MSGSTYDHAQCLLVAVVLLLDSVVQNNIQEDLDVPVVSISATGRRETEVRIEVGVRDVRRSLGGYRSPCGCRSAGRTASCRGTGVDRLAPAIVGQGHHSSTNLLEFWLSRGHFDLVRRICAEGKESIVGEHKNQERRWL